MIEWKSQLLEELVTMRALFLSQGGFLATDIREALLQRLTSVGSTPSDRAWSSFSDALEQLSKAVAEGELDKKAIERCRNSFSRLIQTSSKLPADTKTGSAIADYVLGCYGLFLMHVLETDYRAAAIMMYRSTEDYPAAATQVFPEAGFTNDFREIIRRSFHELRRTIKTHANLEQVNRIKKLKLYPTQVAKALIVIPFNCVYASFAGLAPNSERRRPNSRRSASYTSRVESIYKENIMDFDNAALEKGWLIGRNHIQKEEMLLDQVKRIRSIYNNHCLAAGQDARAKRRELEGMATFG